MDRHRLGISRVEILIVLVIVGMLTAIVIPNFIALCNVFKENQVIGEMSKLQQAVEEYRIDHYGAYPLSIEEAITELPGGQPQTNPFTRQPMRYNTHTSGN